ncbi:MAG: GGDEF domain-containing protein [Nitrospira sp.]|nr:MAG: GGDEF domain-containing protein [Nitrospira sp.]
MKTFFAFLIPGGVVFLAAIGFLRPHGLPSWVQGPVQALPYIVLGFGLVFGWYLSSGRLILSLIMLAFADRAVILFPPTDPDPGSANHVIFAATTFLLPLNLMALSVIKEEAISTWRGVLRLPLVLIQPFLVLWLSLPEQASLALSLQQPLLPMLMVDWTALPQPTLLAFCGALLLIGVRFIVQKNPLDCGALWALVTSCAAFQGLHYGWSATNFLSAAGLILFLTLLQASHQQTYRDDLTGIPGKLAYEEAVANLGKKYVLAVVGIDQLKQYGNQHGKPVSEQLLRLIAQKIMAAADSGKVFRLAGEEFTILFPRKTATETLVTLEAIRKAVEQTTMYLRGRDRVWEGGGASHTGSSDEELVVTASIGLAEAGNSQSSLGLVTKIAYKALYEAKGEGGNLVKRGAITPETKKPVPAEAGRIVAYNEFENS